MSRRTPIIIERRYAAPEDPDYEQDLEICADILLKVAGFSIGKGKTKSYVRGNSQQREGTYDELAITKLV